MKVTLISPQFAGSGLTVSRFFRIPPLGVYRIASNVPESWEVEVIDENVENLTYNKTDLVGISAFSSQANRGYEIAKKYKQKGVTVIMGGVHVSMMPEEAMKYVDSVVVGEADLLWPKILKDFEQKNLKEYYEVKHYPDLSKIPLLNRKLIEPKKYFFKNLLQTSRGCPFNCKFCTVTKFSGRVMRHRPIDQVLAEISNMTGRPKKAFFFMDDNIAGDPNYAENLFGKLRGMDKRWVSQASIHLAKNDRLLKLAAQSGCKAVFVGFESLSSKSLNEIGKSAKAKEYARLIRKFHDHGIAVMGGFIFGFDSDHKDSFKRTVDFCIDVDLDIVQYTVLTPLPGSSLYKEYDKQDRLTTKNWDKYDTTSLVYEPKCMTKRELEEGMAWCYKNFYSYKSIAKRVMNLISKIGWKYALAILVTNIEVHGSYKEIFEVS